jgi:peptide/nickel transport system permease protein
MTATPPGAGPVTAGIGRRIAGSYLASRIVTTVIVLFGATILLFALTQFVPGDPAKTLLGPRASPEAVEALRTRMGLDLPVWQQVLRFLGHIAQGDLGTDAISGRPILAMVLDVLPYTLTLTFSAIGLAVLLGVPLGCYSATHPGSLADRVLALVSVSFIAMPNFVVAIYLVLIFSIWLDWLPVLGASRSGGLGDQLLRLILPTVSLALGWVGYIARLVRSSLLEVLDQNFIRTSRAYGVSEARIVYKYALKNAAVPTVAVLGLGVGRLLGGAIFAEIIFARPGLGTLIYSAISTRNYPIVQAGVLVVVFLFVFTNLLVDLSYSWLDPRISRRSATAGGQ